MYHTTYGRQNWQALPHSVRSPPKTLAHLLSANQMHFSMPPHGANSMDAASYLIFMFLPALVLLTAFCMYNKIKETRDREDRLRRMGYPNPPAFESPLRLPPAPDSDQPAPPYAEAVNMRTETIITIDNEHFNVMRQTYFEDTAHPIFSPFEPPPPYSSDVKCY